MNSAVLNIKFALQVATAYLKKRDIDSPRLTAELLLSYLLQKDKTYLYINYKKPLSKKTFLKYWDLIKRRAKKEPLAYILGKKEFWSLEFEVNPSVLIPRPETELLVEKGITLLKSVENPIILEIGTGSGAIAISLAKELPNAIIYATDISKDAIEVAFRNALRHKVINRIKFIVGNIYDPIKEIPKFHLIITNPPYISEKEYTRLPEEIKNWEPRIALYGGKDGLSVIKKIICKAHKFLHQGGYILMEIAPYQSSNITRLFKETGQYNLVQLLKDYSGLFRIAIACKN